MLKTIRHIWKEKRFAVIYVRWDSAQTSWRIPIGLTSNFEGAILAVSWIWFLTLIHLAAFYAVNGYVPHSIFFR